MLVARARLAVLVHAALLLPACGAGTTAAALRPSAETAASVRGSEAVAFLASDAEPLIVDWKPEQRGDLEVAMKGGVAVVSVRPEGMRLLADCRIEGAYGFLGMTTKQEVMRLENQDELEANLPFAAVGIAAKLGSGLARGSTLDIAMVMVGKLRTTWPDAAATDLRGACDGASHFVRSATIGAVS